MTAPLTPVDCDLRGLTFMPLDTQRLRDSDLALFATGDEFKAAVLLWCAAWQRVPAGALPDEDRVLCRLSGLEPRAWAKAKEGALRGWVKCDDGLLYHPVVAEKALEAWDQRQAHRRKRDADRERLKGWRERKAGGDETQAETRSDTLIETPNETRFETSKTGEGSGEKGKEEKGSGDPGGSLPAAPTSIGKPEVDKAWSAAHARGRERSSRKDVERALKAAVNRGHLAADVIAALETYYASPDATKNDGEYAKGVHRMIENDRWLEYRPAPLIDGGATIDAPSEVRQRSWMSEFRDHPNSWRQERGPEPGRVGCRVSPEIQREFGVEPAKPAAVRGVA